MMKRKFAGIILALLLTGMLTLAFNIQPVKATGTVYIRADGSIDPPTAPISTADNVTYYFTGNVFDEIVVERDNIVVDGAGYTLQGTGEIDTKGISLPGTGLGSPRNVTIRNMEIREFYHGIWLGYSSKYNMISGNNITANGRCGIYFDWYCEENSIISNNIVNNSRGIDLGSFPKNNKILGNNITLSSWVGIYLWNSDNSSILDNNIANNDIGIWIRYSEGNEVKKNNITENRIGVELDWSSGNEIHHNNFNYNGKLLFQEGQFVFIYQQLFIPTYVSPGYTNFLDDGYPFGGNYWNDCDGTDVLDGPYQNITGSDGIGDTPYVINADNQDRYPLMHPWSPLPVHNINTGLGYAAIQEAINANETLNGHTIFVEAGIYYENVIVNKTLSLIGENRDITTIDGGSVSEGVTVKIIANNVVFRGFTTKASGLFSVNILLNETADSLITSNKIIGGEPFISGVKVHASTNVTLTENNITGSGPGIVISDSSYVSVSENNIAPPNGAYVTTGVGLLKSFNNIVSNNNLTNISSSAILLSESSNNTIAGNYITGYEHPSLGISGIGVRIGHIPGENTSSCNVFYDNTIKSTYYAIVTGFFIGEGGHHDNIFWRNNVENNYYGIFWHNSSNNIFCHNNFINNTIQVYNKDAVNAWDDGYPSGGNYWSNYTGVDTYGGSNQDETGSDGIGDAAHEIDADNRDQYPLMAPLIAFDAGVWNGEAYSVDIVSNSTLSDFKLNATQKTLSFNVTGLEGKAGFCRVTIPNIIIQDLWHGNYAVLLNGDPWPFRNWTDTTNTYIYINYTHSEHEITIIPEFPSTIIVLLFMIATLLAVIVYRRKHTI